MNETKLACVAFCHPCHSPQSWAILNVFQYSVSPQLRSVKCLYIQRKCTAATPSGTRPLLPPSHPQNHLFLMLITFFSKAVNIDLDPVCTGPPPSFGRQVSLVTFDAKKVASLQEFGMPKSKRNQAQISSTGTLYEANVRFYCLSRYQKH